MFLRRVLPQLRYFASLITLKLSRSIPPIPNSFPFSRACLLFLSAPSFVLCNSNQPDLSQIAKQELVQLLHRASHEFVVIIYDKFKRLHEKQFGEELKPILDECRQAGLKAVYLIDSKESQHLNQIVRLLKNLPPHDQPQEQRKVKSFQVYYKAKHFNEAFELERNKDQSLSQQIKEIRHYQFTANPETLTNTLTTHMNNPWNINKTVVVKQCLGEGECVESFRREVTALIEQGMLSGKKDEFQFQLVVDQPSAILGSSSEYVKSFMRETEKLRGRGMSANRKEQTYVFRKDLLGNEVGVFTEWLQKQGLNYSNGDRFMMFLKPRLQLISKGNTMSDLLWFIRSSRLNQQACLSLNNAPKFSRFNSQQSLSLLKLAHSHFPSLNYLIVSSEKVGELIRHLHADHKYVLFHMDSSPIWKKEFIDMDHLESLAQKERQTAFVKEFKQKFQGFIDNPQIKNLVQVQRQLQIGLEKLMVLRNRQEQRSNLRKYIVRVCKQRCKRDLPSEILQQVNEKLQQPAPVYWIDSTAQNVGVPSGDYLLKDGALFPLQQHVL